jgi:hypothetical protein
VDQLVETVSGWLYVPTGNLETSGRCELAILEDGRQGVANGQGD